jgi:hypothetical protein
MADKSSKNRRRSYAMSILNKLVTELESQGVVFKTPVKTNDLELKHVQELERAAEMVEHLWNRLQALTNQKPQTEAPSTVKAATIDSKNKNSKKV